jgi:hypothetical protein
LTGPPVPYAGTGKQKPQAESEPTGEGSAVRRKS